MIQTIKRGFIAWAIVLGCLGYCLGVLTLVSAPALLVVHTMIKR